MNTDKKGRPKTSSFGIGVSMAYRLQPRERTDENQTGRLRDRKILQAIADRILPSVILLSIQRRTDEIIRIDFPSFLSVSICVHLWLTLVFASFPFVCFVDRPDFTRGSF